MLGFDAIGRQALGQIPTFPFTNTFLNAAGGTVTVTGNDAAMTVSTLWVDAVIQAEVWTDE